MRLGDISVEDVSVNSLTLKCCRDVVVIMRNHIQLTLHLAVCSVMRQRQIHASALYLVIKSVYMQLRSEIRAKIVHKGLIRLYQSSEVGGAW